MKHQQFASCKIVLIRQINKDKNLLNVRIPLYLCAYYCTTSSVTLKYFGHGSCVRVCIKCESR